MFLVLFVLIIYLTFLIDFLVIPIPSEASTKSLLGTTENYFLSRFIILGSFALNLIIYVSPLVYSIHLWFNTLVGEVEMRFLAFGFLISLVGRVFTLTGAVELKRCKGDMTSDSVFKWSRNPIALGMHITLLGLIMMVSQWFLLGGLIFSVWNIHRKIITEEQFLVKRFGKNYLKYMDKTPRYL